MNGLGYNIVTTMFPTFLETKFQQKICTYHQSEYCYESPYRSRTLIFGHFALSWLLSNFPKRICFSRSWALPNLSKFKKLLFIVLGIFKCNFITLGNFKLLFQEQNVLNYFPKWRKFASTNSSPAAWAGLTKQTYR